MREEDYITHDRFIKGNETYCYPYREKLRKDAVRWGFSFSKKQKMEYLRDKIGELEKRLEKQERIFQEYADFWEKRQIKLSEQIKQSVNKEMQNRCFALRFDDGKVDRILTSEPKKKKGK